MKLFLDDERFPPDINLIWVTVRSYEEAVTYCQKHGCPSFISFDHDLGCDKFGNPNKTGYDFVKWLVDMDIEHGTIIPQCFTFTVHSQNPVGAKNIQMYLDNYLNTRDKETRG